MECRRNELIVEKSGVVEMERQWVAAQTSAACGSRPSSACPNYDPWLCVSVAVGWEGEVVGRT
jgi:hypothetical protein